jgi:hypothetical protein
VLEYKIAGENLSYRWTNCVKDFNLRVRNTYTKDDPITSGWLQPTTEWKNLSATKDLLEKGLQVDRNFYVSVKKVE